MNNSYQSYLWAIQLKPYFQPKSTVLHVQRRDSPRKPPLSSQPIKVQVPKSLIVQPINKEKQRVVLKNQPYQTKQAFMLQTPNKPISNTISVPTTVYQKPINPRSVQAWLEFRDYLFSALRLRFIRSRWIKYFWRIRQIKRSTLFKGPNKMTDNLRVNISAKAYPL